MSHPLAARACRKKITCTKLLFKASRGTHFVLGEVQGKKGARGENGEWSKEQGRQ
jgi:hypothetical protein